MDNQEYLYHYTSIDTLASVLKNKTIRFKSLIDVDDKEEAETRDMGCFGKFTYVSCWTSSIEESIPLWSIYTDKMNGVRIKLPKFPFVKYYYKKGEYNFSIDCESYIDYEKIYNDNKVTVPANNPKLIQVNYTENEDLIYPRIKKYNNNIKTLFVETDLLGRYKRDCWAFQKEWRYRIRFDPVSEKRIIEEFLKINSLDIKERDEYAKRCFDNVIKLLLDSSISKPYDYFDLKIKQKHINNIEIIMGPKTSAVEKKMIRSLAKEYCNNAEIKESGLKIR